MSKSEPKWVQEFKPNFLSHDQWEFFRIHGFLKIDGVLSPSDVSALKELAYPLIAKAHAIPLPENLEHGDFHTDFEGSHFVLKKSPQGTSIQRIVGIKGAAPELYEATRHPLLLRTVGDLIHSPLGEQLIAQFHVKEPGDGVSFFPHRDVEFRLSFDPDWQDVNGWGSYVICLFALDDAEPSNGCLWAIPGSHQGLDLSQIRPAREIPNLLANPNAVPLTAKAGDLLIMHAHLIHWSGPNEDQSQTRMTLLSGFAVPGANHGRYPGSGVNEIVELK